MALNSVVECLMVVCQLMLVLYIISLVAENGTGKFSTGKHSVALSAWKNIVVIGKLASLYREDGLTLPRINLWHTT